MNNNTQPVVILTKWYDFVLWMTQKVQNYPKSYKYTLGDRIQTQMLDILEMFVVAQYNKDQRKQTLRHINIAIERLRYLIRLSKDLHCLSMAHYEFAAKQLLELGKMVGGWEKQNAKAI